MVATRRGAKATADPAPAAPSTLNAPPKRGKKKAVEEDVAAPAPAKAKATKTTAAKRKATVEPEAAELPAKKKTVTAGRATRAAKIEREEPASVPAPKRATRGRKIEEPTPAVEENDTVEASKPATTRGRKAPAKKAVVPEVEELVEVVEAVAEEVTKPTTQTRKSSARKAPVKKVVAEESALSVVEEAVVSEPVDEAKPAPRSRKASAPKPAPVPTLTARATRARNAVVAPQESPLKAPPRKPAKKAAVVTTTKSLLDSVRKPVVKASASTVTNEMPTTLHSPTQAMAEFPQYPTTPAHIAAPVTVREALLELPNYPQTPAHIVAPITSQAALAQMPGYPQTPAHIVAPVSNRDALAEMAGYPQTPAHITAPITSQAALAEMPGYPKTPAHIVAPMTNKDALAEMPDYPKTPAHITAPITSQAALTEMPDYPKTPAHIVAPISNDDALAELPGYPKTPAHITAPITSQAALAELPDYPKTPAHIMAPVSNEDALSELPDYCETSAHISIPHNEENIEESRTFDFSSSHHQDQAKTPVPSEEKRIDDQTTLEQIPSVQQTPIYSERSAPQSERKPLAEVPDLSKSPYHSSARQFIRQNLFSSPPDAEGTPMHLMSPLASTPAKHNFNPTEPPMTPPQQTPEEITNQEALAQLPSYPRTPTHIKAPVSNKDALAELPSCPNTPALIMEAAIQAEISASVKKQSPSPSHFTHSSELSVASVDGSPMSCDNAMQVDSEPVSLPAASTLKLAPLKLVPSGPTLPNPFITAVSLDFAPSVPASAPAPAPASPTKSILRSPQKMDPKTPKKAVTWEDDESPERSEAFMFDGPLQGMTFYIDVISNGMNQSFLFSTLIEDLGAKVKREWHPKVTHVLFKNGSNTTLRHVLASNGAVKCMNIGWVLECENQGRRVEIEPYLVDLSAGVTSPAPKPCTPTRTPSRLALPPSSDIASRPSTPTSSEFDRSFHEDDNKENSGPIQSLLETFGNGGKLRMRTQPVNRIKRSFLFDRSPIKTPSRPNFLKVSPVKAFSTSKKRSAEATFDGILNAPPKKLRFV